MMIFSYREYREYLKAELAARKERRPGYSARAFAKALGVSPAMFTEVVQGKKKLSGDLARTMAKGLRLKPNESDYFVLLVQANQAEDPKLKEELERRLDGFLPPADAAKVSMDQWRKTIQWYFTAIREMTELADTELTPATASNRLGISRREAELAIDTLIGVGMLERGEDGRLRKPKRVFTFQGEGITDEMVAHLRQNYERGELPHTRKPGRGVRKWTTLPISPELLPELRQAMELFMRQLRSIAERSEKPRTEVYHVLLHCFPFTKPEVDDT